MKIKKILSATCLALLVSGTAAAGTIQCPANIGDFYTAVTTGVANGACLFNGSTTYPCTNPSYPGFSIAFVTAPTSTGSYIGADWMFPVYTSVLFCAYSTSSGPNGIYLFATPAARITGFVNTGSAWSQTKDVTTVSLCNYATAVEQCQLTTSAP